MFVFFKTLELRASLLYDVLKIYQPLAQLGGRMIVVVARQS